MTMLIAGIGSSPAVGPTSGGKMYAYNNIGTAPSVVASANAQRTSITFYNPGSVNIYVAPQQVQALNTPPTNQNGVLNISNQPLTPSPTALGGCFIIYANGGSIRLDGECQGSWQAFAATGAANPLTVSDSNA